MKKKTLKEYTKKEVEKHNKPNDCWIIVHGMVIDVTKFLKEHPEVSNHILAFAGKDASDIFDKIQILKDITKQLSNMTIGKVKN